MWDKGELQIAGALLIIAVCLMGLFVWAGSRKQAYDQVTRECVSAGYVEQIYFNSVTLCIGVVDGRYAIEPVEDVRERLETN